METPEVIDQNTPAEKPAKAGKVKACLHCGNDFTYKLESAQFCSGTCRATHAVKKKKLGATHEGKEEKPMPTINSNGQLKLSGLPPQAEYIIYHQNTVIADWRRQYEEEKAEHKRLREKYKELKERISEKERAMELQGIENAKPSILDQLATVVPEDVRSKVLGALADKLLNSGATVQTGVEGIDQNFAAIQKWYGALPPPLQQKVFEILNALAMISDAETFEIRTTAIANMLKNFNPMRSAAN